MSISSVAPFANFSPSRFDAARSLVPQGSELKRNRHYERNNEVVSYANAFRSLRLRAESQNDAEGTRSAASLQLSSRAKSIEFEDGTVRNESTTKLRFRYSFESEDGTKIAVRAEAKLSISQQASASGDNQSVKVRARFFVGAIQEQVASGTNSLTEGVELPESVQTIVAQALGLFQDVTDTLANQTTSGTAVDGDALIQGLAEAFNAFASSVLQPFLGSNSEGNSNPEEIPNTEPAIASPPAIESAPTTSVSKPTSPAPSPIGPDTRPAPDVPTASDLETSEQKGGTEGVDAPASSTASTSDKAPAAPTDTNNGSQAVTNAAATTEEPSPEATPEVAGSGIESLRSKAEATLLRIRVSVVQSLTQLARSFEGDDDSTNSSRSSLFVSARIDYRSTSFSRFDGNAPLIGSSVDVDG